MSTPLPEASNNVSMDKKSTDKAFNRWFLKCLLGPSSLLALLAFVVGYWWPKTMLVVQPAAQLLGLHQLVAMRTTGAEFDSAVYLHWLTFWVTLPFNLAWMHCEGVKRNMAKVLRTVARSNLESGRWNPQKYSLRGGYARFLFFVLFCGSMFVTQLVTAREPSFCKGCETSSVLGFVLINWLGTNATLIATYVSFAYLVLWKSIRTTFGGKNE